MPDGRPYRAHHFASTAQEGDDPTQTWHASHIQYEAGDNGGFAASIADTVPGTDPGMPMRYWTDADIPFYHGLAKIFPVADRWFCSCLGPTFPNRRFLISGTAHGLIDDLPWDLVDYPPAGTIFDQLSAAGTPPAFSLIDPDFGAYSEENPQDISHGESFAAAVVDAVMRGPAWESTLLLWIYDEHGGYYDHVPPPEAVAPDDVPAYNWQLGLPPWLRTLLEPLLSRELAELANADTGPAVYDRLGFRVPPVLPVPKAGPFHPSRRARANREPGRRSARRS